MVPDSSTWSDPPKLTGSGSQPYETWDLVSTAAEETINFKMMTNFPGRHHLSDVITLTIECGPNYVISGTTVASPQSLKHFLNMGLRKIIGSGNTGFVLPTSIETIETGQTACPVDTAQ